MLARVPLRNYALRAVYRFYSEGSGQPQGTGSSFSGPPPPAVVEVPGLSSAVVEPATQAVGPDVDPNKSGPYKSPEYFCYNTNSYYEAEVEMSKFRLPQPSATKN